MARSTLAGNSGGQGPCHFISPNDPAPLLLAHRPRKPVRAHRGGFGRTLGPGVFFLVGTPIRKGTAVSEPDDSLRVSDAERDAEVRTLGDHAAVGRLTLDELEERSGRALTAKTRGDLATLTGDLPQEAGQGRPAPAPARK